MMNRIILALFVIFAFFTRSEAQDFLAKVPANASVVIKYAGENFSKNVPLKKLDSYRFVKEHLLKELKIDSLESLQNTGINFEQDTYQYVTLADSSMSFVSLLHLNNLPKFLKLLDANYHAEMKPEKMNGFEFLPLSGNTYIGWNDAQAVLVVTRHMSSNRSYASMEDAVTVVDTPADTTAVMAPVEELPPPPPPVEAPKKIKPKSKQPGAKGKPGMKAPVKKPTVKAPPQKPLEEELIIDTVTTIVPYSEDYAPSNWDSLFREREKITNEKQKTVAGNIIRNVFTANLPSIESDISYKKVTDAGAHISLWLNYQNILNQYWATMFGMQGPYRSPLGSSMNDNVKGNDETFRTGVNIYFDKDKMRIEQRSFSPDEQMANLGKDLYNNKQSPELIKYVNPDNIGYLSMSLNTEAMTNYYYKIIKQYMSSSPYVGDYADIAEVYIDLLQIIIDEKAIAELMPGNCLLVLHDMKTMKVNYTDYEYDDDFKYKEVKKTKQELSPNFTFIAETKREAFMEKLVNLPLKYAKKGDYNYFDRGGYYELVFDTGQVPLSSLYFMVKNGRVIVTTSKASIDFTLNNSGYTPDAATKNSILSNNYSVRINSKRLIQQLGPEINTGTNRKVTKYLEENIGDLVMESRLKNGMMQGTTTMAVTGNHENSLEFFFNMIDAINDIMEKDKEESEKKLN